MRTTDINTQTVFTCNQLLRGELSAVETYEQAIEKFAREPEAMVFIGIRDRHEGSVEQLRGKVELMAGDPSVTSGAWGMFANTVQATANMLGKDSALETLKRGEAHGISEYESALGASELEDDCVRLIRDILLPRCRENIDALEQLNGK
ncbi:DUF2383 domain-containing protein [Pelagicoccus sp. SDUM812002]|uniref:DUF2383 domain-containing protein n=1 Tax=Pelagicoccus sp. SDUM812002 TaxID=3041266 RepID=UPI00280F4CC7|nr:DUF2383 domain-containing protein [Pelagicoccus sp. SDUM812002]MDQ8186135.1 DUF2383 domain-containing protein [Pelagicoccus sp. SDUM812002]